ncbi:MAG: hypothetical protein AAB431_01910 [Patescibacteria group bacterium]
MAIFLCALLVFLFSLWFVRQKTDSVAKLQEIKTELLPFAEFDDEGNVLFLDQEKNTFFSGSINDSDFRVTPIISLEEKSLIRRVGWSRDYQCVAVNTSEDTSIYCLDKKVIRLHTSITSLAWSLDSKKIVYQTRPDVARKSEARIYDLTTGKETRVTTLDLSDQGFGEGNVSFLWIDDQTIAYAPEVGDQGGGTYWLLKNGTEHRSEDPTIFQDILASVFSPDGKNALVITPSFEDLGQDNRYGFIHLSPASAQITKISTSRSRCRWQTNQTLFCATQTATGFTHVGIIDVLSGAYTQRAVTKNLPITNIQNEFYQPEKNRTLFLLSSPVRLFVLNDRV